MCVYVLPRLLLTHFYSYIYIRDNVHTRRAKPGLFGILGISQCGGIFLFVFLWGFLNL